ncbi:MAG TPA: GTPase domain-containing protein [Polyangiales bacterium]|nr:GTPase domain-containing protein [Polyangiales bacterium]
MPYIDHARKELRFKIVYYGPGLGGKTTNIEYIHQNTRAEHRGKLITLNNDAERTLFFDLLPVHIGRYRDYVVRVHLCTVPGQLAQEDIRRLVLRHVDGVVFVVDCQPQRALDNVQSMRDLKHNLSELGIDAGKLPTVVQWNKRDLVGAPGVDKARRFLQIPPGVVQVIASASKGEGVFETFKAVLKECLAVVEQPWEAPEGHSPSIIPGHRASMYPEAEPGSELHPVIPKPPRPPAA